MPFREFWKPNLNKDEIEAVKILEHQIIALDKEWMHYDKHNFIDWNTKFKGLKISQITPEMQIPLRDSKIEKTEFSKLWKDTSELFAKTISMINKGKTRDAIILLFVKLKEFEETIVQLENNERRTITFLRQHHSLFEKLFNNNYGEDFFDSEVIDNYEVRFKLLEMLKNEYDLVKYLLAEVI